ncbi:HTH domain-containing protein [Latilactobacillus curvatus]|nr:HTH domain-containing protein [Latilactobacillus curvatus]
MNKKMELLLDILLQQDDYLTASQLAQIIGVTERSIRNYVRNLNGNQYQEPLIIATNAGYKIQKAIYNESVKNQLLDKDVTNILFRQITSLIRTSPESFNGSLLMMYF